MTQLQSKIVSGGLLVLSVAITYFSFNFSFSHAFAGQAVNIWAPLGAFVLSIGLVLVAIIVQFKAKR
jgi:hypothetical protein